MSRTTFITLIVTIVLIVLGTIGYFIYKNTSATKNNTKTVSYLPFGSTNNNTQNGNQGNSSQTNTSVSTSTDNHQTQGPATVQKQALILLSNQNIASATFIDAPIIQTIYATNTKTGIVTQKFVKATTTKIRYIEKPTGLIYDINPDGSGKTQITGTTIPRISSAYFLENGSLVRLTYTSDTSSPDQAFLATIPEKKLPDPKATTTEPDLPVDLVTKPIANSGSNFSLSPDNKQLFSFIKNGVVFSGIIESKKLTSSKTIVTIPTNEWQTQWFNPNKIAITTKPSSGIMGTLFFLGTDGALTPILKNVSDLSALVNPKGDSILYGTDEAGAYMLHVLVLGKNKTTTLSRKTIPDKCVWSQKNDLYCAIPQNLGSLPLPESWYRGFIVFTDTLVKINPNTDESISLTSGQTTKGTYPLDISQLKVSNDSSYILFTNKRDGTLWLFNLNL